MLSFIWLKPLLPGKIMQGYIPHPNPSIPIGEPSGIFTATAGWNLSGLFSNCLICDSPKSRLAFCSVPAVARALPIQLFNPAISSKAIPRTFSGALELAAKVSSCFNVKIVHQSLYLPFIARLL